MTIQEATEESGGLPALDVAKDFYSRYEPKEILGSGASCTVRRCVEKATDKEFAVKIIDLTGEKENEFHVEIIKKSIANEIALLRECHSHRYIIKLHDTYESSTFIFMVLELCARGELFDYLTDVVTLSEKRTRHVMKQLLEAVQFMHSKDIVHRDLKPENILLDDDLNVKVSDFGFAARIPEDGSNFTELCGTPGYLAPEVLRVSMYDNADGYNLACDMWAIGVIMYTLLCGAPPFWSRRQLHMLRAIMEGRYSFDNPEWSDISDTPKDLISKLLVVDVKKRYTVDQALAHPFFITKESAEVPKPFNPRRFFKVRVHVIMAVQFLKTWRSHPPVISMETMRTDPYAMRNIRKIIDAGAFKIYGHWVKKGENQNRAALFENVPRNSTETDER